MITSSNAGVWIIGLKEDNYFDKKPQESPILEVLAPPLKVIGMDRAMAMSAAEIVLGHFSF